MGKIIDFLAAKNAHVHTPPLPTQMPKDMFDFDEELLNLIGITSDLEHSTNPGQVKRILSDAIDHVMTWPDDG